MDLEDFFQALDMSFRFVEMALESFFQLGGAGPLRHFWEGLHKLFFSIIEIAHLFDP
jgi:hypothetical protein